LADTGKLSLPYHQDHFINFLVLHTIKRLE
jgi:hypothetical protein